jgi:ABC-type branched-subunit amino acid transport system ATPase component
VLEVRDIDVHYGDAQALYGMRLEVAEGETVTLVGSNGAGKTTTLRAISGILPLSRGEIRFEGRSLAKVPAHQRPGLGIGLAPVLVRQVFDTIRRLRGEGLTILLVEQNLKKALEVADRGYVVETGRISLRGRSAELLEDPAVQAAYLGI